MKRISFFVLLGFMVNPCMGRTREFVTYITGVRYSPYAFGIHHSGLIPSRVSHSPYAFSIYRSGLVSDYVAYSPYAFGVHRNGLVSSIGSHHVPLVTWHDPGRWGAAGPVNGTCHEDPATGADYETGGTAGVLVRSRPLRRVAARPRTDYKQMVCDSLDGLVPGRYRIRRVLRLDGQAVSFDVYFEDVACIIKYWNHAKIESIKRAGGSHERAYSRYLKSWARNANEFERAGGEVRHFVSRDELSISEELAALVPRSHVAYAAK